MITHIRIRLLAAKHLFKSLNQHLFQMRFVVKGDHNRNALQCGNLRQSKTSNERERTLVNMIYGRRIECRRTKGLQIQFAAQRFDWPDIFEINFQPWKCQGYLTINSRTIRRLADMQKQLIQISWRFSGYRLTNFFLHKKSWKLKSFKLKQYGN